MAKGAKKEMNRRHYITREIIAAAARPRLSRERVRRVLKLTRRIDPLLVVLAIAAALCIGSGIWLWFATHP